MKRVLVGIWILLMAGVAGAAPARPHYEPQKAEMPPLQLDLRGSTWTGKCYNHDCQVTFNADGTIQYTRDVAGKSRVSGGGWRVTDNELIFDINKFSEHRGVITGNTIQGASTNKAGLQGKFHLQRTTSP